MSDHKMMIRADARAMGAVTALSTTNRRKARTYTRASTCISYTMADKSDAVIFRAERAERKIHRHGAELSDRAFNYVAPSTAANLSPVLAD